MNQLLYRIDYMISKRLRKTPYVDMDGYKIYYEGIGSKHA